MPDKSLNLRQIKNKYQKRNLLSDDTKQSEMNKNYERKIEIQIQK